MSQAIVKDYFAIPYKGKVFVYTNVLTLEGIKKSSFSELLSHRQALDKKSVAMAIHNAIKRHYGDMKGKKVLDVGCSIGHFSFLMAEEGAKVIGVDCEAGKVKVARAIAKIRALNVTFVKARIENHLDSISDQVTFDLVLMHSVFDYIPVEQNTQVLMKLSQISGRLYSTVKIDPNFVLRNSDYSKSEKLLEKIYGIRDLWAFWR